MSIDIDVANAGVVLNLVYNRSDLALLTGALPLRALKMRIGLESTVTEDDVAQLLLAVAKGLGVNLSNLSCDKAISKLIINLYYGYVVCPYTVQDIDEFISYVKLLGMNKSKTLILSVSLKLLTVKLGALNLVSIPLESYQRIYDELLQEESIVLAVFINSFVKYARLKLESSVSSRQNVPIETLIRQVEKVEQQANASTSRSVFSAEDVLKLLAFVVEQYGVAEDIKMSDVAQAILASMQVDVSKALDVINRSIAKAVKGGGLYRGSRAFESLYEYYGGGEEYTKEFTPGERPTSIYEIAPSGIPLEEAVKYGVVIEDVRRGSSTINVSETSSRKVQVFTISADMFKERVKAGSLSEIIARSNIVVFTSALRSTSEAGYIGSEPVVVGGRDLIVRIMEFSSYLTIIGGASAVALAILTFRKRIVVAVSTLLRRPLVGGESLEPVNRVADRRYTVLLRFWNAVELIAKRASVGLEPSDTHREVLEKLRISKLGVGLLRIVEEATRLYEIVRFSLKWSDRDLEALEKIVGEAEKQVK
jgi:hypothetical protein